MSLPVRLGDEASAELLDAARWYEERQSGLGGVFLVAADRTIDSIAEWPGTGRPMEPVRPDREARRIRIGRFPYYAAYVVHDDHVLVVAIAHKRRRPRYWMGRVR